MIQSKEGSCVCCEIKQSTLQASLQLDESTDTALESQLIAFARYEKEGRPEESLHEVTVWPYGARKTLHPPVLTLWGRD